MNKKLKAILIIGILLLTGLSAVSTVGGKNNVKYNSQVDLVKVNNEDTEPWLDGPYNGKVGEELTYCIRGTEDLEPEGGLYGLFDWGDFTHTEWLGPYSPGEDICASKIYETGGNKFLTVTLKDESDLWMTAWGRWINIEKKSKSTFNLLFLQFLERFPFLEQLLSLL